VLKSDVAPPASPPNPPKSTRRHPEETKPPSVHVATPTQPSQGVSTSPNRKLKYRITAILDRATVDDIPTTLGSLFEAIGWTGDKGTQIALRANQGVVGKLLNCGSALCSSFGESPPFVSSICHWIRLALQSRDAGERDNLSEMLRVRYLSKAGFPSCDEARL
jgi:hypothetical protein